MKKEDLLNKTGLRETTRIGSSRRGIAIATVRKNAKVNKRKVKKDGCSGCSRNKRIK